MKIIKSAIKYQGKIYIGVRHGLILRKIPNLVKGKPVPQADFGFMTDTGKFVSREEAARIAFEAGQIPNGINSLDSYQIFPL